MSKSKKFVWWEVWHVPDKGDRVRVRVGRSAGDPAPPGESFAHHAEAAAFVGRCPNDYYRIVRVSRVVRVRA